MANIKLKGDLHELLFKRGWYDNLILEPVCLKRKLLLSFGVKVVCVPQTVIVCAHVVVFIEQLVSNFQTVLEVLFILLFNLI